jgi:hypothetical protein
MYKEVLVYQISEHLGIHSCGNDLSLLEESVDANFTGSDHNIIEVKLSECAVTVKKFAPKCTTKREAHSSFRCSDMLGLHYVLDA